MTMYTPKYENEIWGAPIAGERKSTNGYYTGEHKGTPMQDALVEGVQGAHGVEENTVHMGTITSDKLGTPKVKSE